MSVGHNRSRLMSVQDIEVAIGNLSEQQLKELREWFVELDSKLWDHQIENDVAAGRLDHLAEQALRDRDHKDKV